jgi:hypothetical protein
MRDHQPKIVVDKKKSVKKEKIHDENKIFN